MRWFAVVTFLGLLLGNIAGTFLMGYPLINDITTTPDNPPRFISRAIPDYPPRFAEIQRKAYPDLAPLHTPLPLDRLIPAVAAVAREMPRWEIVLADGATGRVEAVSTTLLFRFKDDVVIEIRPEPSGGHGIHMRSRSRLGKGDLGVNAKRIREYLERLKAQLARP